MEDLVSVLVRSTVVIGHDDTEDGCIYTDYWYLMISLWECWIWRCISLFMEQMW